MCAIIGALVWDANAKQVARLNGLLNSVCAESLERGRDGRGWYVQSISPNERYAPTRVRIPGRDEQWDDIVPFFPRGEVFAGGMVANLRAEPTTEYVKDKREADQQPYSVGPWTIVHNGTIANDKDLRTYEVETGIDSAAIVETLARDHMRGHTAVEVAQHFGKCIQLLQGSYAILAVHDEHPAMIMVAANYRPIWFIESDNSFVFASARHYFPEGHAPQMVMPYTAWAFGPGMRMDLTPDRGDPKRALVVCSGGLDSVVAATYAKANGFDVELAHFRYGSRAEGPEVKAVHDVAEALGVPLHIIPMGIYDPADSPLLRADSAIAGGEAGAEFAHEWVPARNLVMLALATAYSEAKGFDTIILGNNLEEAGAYPDNEPEFIARFNDLLPFAVADGKRVRVSMPVGNLMKHEIVALGHQLGAPLDKTWSCYRAGEHHCGTCGPCFMRRTAFAINGLPEVITYERN